MKYSIALKYIFYVCTGLIVIMSLMMWGFASEFITMNVILSVISFVAVVIILFIERKPILKILRSHYLRNVFSDSINLFLIVCIIGLVNYLFFMNNKTVDVTETKVHTLSEQSREVVSKFPEKLTITLFAKRVEWETYFELLNQYKMINSNIKISAVDVDENPALAKVQGIVESGQIVINYQDRKMIGKAGSELDITNALLKLLRSKVLKIGYTFGHGEIDLNQQDKNGGSYLRARLQERNYQLAKIDLLIADEIPRDLDLLMVLGPNNGLLDLEVEKIKKFVSEGGNLLIAFGPNFDNLNWSNLISFLKENGANLTNTILLDRLSKIQGSEATIPIITSFNSDISITKHINGRLIFPLTSAITENKKKDVMYTWLARSSTFPASWAETDLIGVVKGSASFDKNDIEGPVDVAVAIENKNSNSKILVWGSAASLVDAYQSNSLNFNIFFNAIAWAMDDEGLMAISRPGIRGERIFLASSQITLIFWGAIVLVPFCLSALGIFFYRRKLVK